ncbi:MAG: diguanylate cyclase domain-containing protein [Thiohalomonadaceae bacterium]
MNRELIQQLTLSEIEQYSLELELAANSHARWLNHLNRTIICQLPPQANDIAEAPHLLCHLGRWYHSINNPAFEALEDFSIIGPVHEKMHAVARELLHKTQQGQAITPDEYDELVMLSDILREHLTNLRGSLNRNRDLIARLMGKVFENADEGVIIAAQDTTIISVNKAFSEVTGYSAEEVIGKTPKMFSSGRQDENFYRHLWGQLESEGQWQGEIWNRNKAGEEYLEWLSIAAVRDEQGVLSHYVAIFSDITSEKENEKRMHKLAHYDQLTGLPNRILFNERLRYALSQAERNKKMVAVMFLDLDGFKPVNDTLGHAAGDQLLYQVAQRLKDCLRASDTVARFGGDEFTIVLPDVDGVRSAAQIAKKIIEQVAKPYQLDGNEVQITTSLGISLYPDHANNPAELIHHADGAMYQAKRQGKNQYHYFDIDDS